MAAVVRLLSSVKVVPVLVLYRDPLQGVVAVVQTVVAPLRALEVVRVVHVRVVVEPVPVGRLPTAGSLGGRAAKLRRGENRQTDQSRGQISSQLGPRTPEVRELDKVSDSSSASARPAPHEKSTELRAPANSSA